MLSLLVWPGAKSVVNVVMHGSSYLAEEYGLHMAVCYMVGREPMPYKHWAHFYVGGDI